MKSQYRWGNAKKEGLGQFADLRGTEGGGQGVGIISEFFLFELLFFVLSCVVSFLSEQSMIAVVSFCL